MSSITLFVEANIGQKQTTKIRRLRFIGDAFPKVVVDLTADD